MTLSSQNSMPGRTPAPRASLEVSGGRARLRLARIAWRDLHIIEVQEHMGFIHKESVSRHALDNNINPPACDAQPPRWLTAAHTMSIAQVFLAPFFEYVD